MKSPQVTVLMPVFNGEKYLRQAIESILGQSFHDFEFLIINDGSSDESSEIISSYDDSRIRVINNEKNSGLIHTLNIGLALALGKYIVRMDCDDISVKSRLSVQVKFMEDNKNIGASGSYYYLLKGGNKAIADFPLNTEEIKCFLLFNSPIAHPTAIIRKSVIKEHHLKYSSQSIHAEDYDLWSQISKYLGLANVKKSLLIYRVHEQQVTTNPLNSSQKNSSVSAIRLRNLNDAGIFPSPEELKTHNLLSDGLVPANETELKEAEQWLLKLIAFNEKNKFSESDYFQKIIMERWFRLCFNFYGGLKAFRNFRKSKLYAILTPSVSRKLEWANSLYYSWKRKGIKK